MARPRKTMDGNTAASHVSYAFTDVAAIYPITPSSPMAEVADTWATEGRKNLFGQEVRILEMQSEAGAAGAVHGSLTSGALTTTYTASQGLLLMIPNMYKIAGEMLPCVIDVSARTVASHALCIFGDHSDVYACRQTGFAMLCESNVQEVMDLTAVAHLSAIKGRVPVLNFFDGFRTSHELQKIEVWDYDDLADMLDWDAVQAFRNSALNPEHPCQLGSAQNPDIFFQAREASNRAYDAFPAIVEENMNKVNAKLGTDYKLFNYYGAPDAEHIIIAMGSVCDTIDETIDYMVARGEKVGVVKVRLYRPFSQKHLLAAIPETVKVISVLDRTKEPGAVGEPLYIDVATALRGTKFHDVKIVHGRYGLGSKDTTPGQIVAVYRNTEKEEFTIGIEDDVTGLSLPIVEDPNTQPESTISCKFWGLGADGTVGANKNSIKIIGDHTDMYVQAYFEYDSKKSGGLTISHLRFGHAPIRSTYFINKANFVACHNPSYVRKYNMVQEVVDGGSFLLNCPWDLAGLEEHLPGQMKRYIAEHNINLYTIDAIKLGQEIGLGGRVNTILQAAFFVISGVIPKEDAIRYMKDAATKSYLKKGEDVVKMNHDGIDAGAGAFHKVEVPASWKDAEDEPLFELATGTRADVVSFVNAIQKPINAHDGQNLPVSTFLAYANGATPSGASAFEKRGVAVNIPVWDVTKCIQCNFCSYVCPHAVIRPVALNEEDVKNAPEGMPMKDLMGMPGYKFSVTVSALDCMGCGSCVNVCPAPGKAIAMLPLDEHRDTQKYFDFAVSLPEKPEVIEKYKVSTVKGSQYKQPLLEFSGACAGCGEAPYAKLITQLFGDRMYIANATGCTSIWGNSSPSTPYTVNKEGKGPAWSNSLFEDNAEFGLGMELGQSTLRAGLADRIRKAAEAGSPALKEAAEEFFDTYEDSALNAAATKKLLAALVAEGDSDNVKYLLQNKEFISKKSQWIFGGDGWAYDIGFGGLDHAIASGRNINIMVFDTEVYSNTGGQSSKATNVGAVAQFAAGGKEVKQKDLAAIAMSYGYVYVAQIAMGADYNQTVKALTEAESYPGPSLIVAYAPCITHGIKAGMGKAQTEEKNAVQAGYWHLFRFDPRKEVPFQLDSKAPTASYQDFLKGENRYTALTLKNPERAEMLFGKSEKYAQEKYAHLLKLQEMYGGK
ncbi:MAG: pyruvate:ferredoxin (flavodoxin) oxidoreductase [Lachnospiraceae bacterium]|nr:pyruvate:ferredoxin (flavodoxin) oxidoreductase [Lachnospiraceae bacterium]